MDVTSLTNVSGNSRSGLIKACLSVNPETLTPEGRRDVAKRIIADLSSRLGAAVIFVEVKEKALWFRWTKPG